MLTISGTGTMPNYTDTSRATWHEHRTEITSVVVEKGVTTVGNYAFADLYKATSVNIPEGVTSIGDYAFEDCSSLESVYIPRSLTTFSTKYDQIPFYNTTAITDIYYAGTEAYSGILRYSVETYAHTVKTGSYDTDLKTLVDKMMRYGDSAARYFGVEIDIPDNPEEPGIPDDTEDANDPKGIYFAPTTLTLPMGTTYRPTVMGVTTRTDLTESCTLTALEGAELIRIEDTLITVLKPGTVRLSAEYIYTPEGGEPVTYTSTPMTITIEGKYHTVTLAAGEGSLPEGTESTFTVLTGETLTALPTPTAPAGCYFVGWFDGDTQVNTTIVITADVTLTAKYAASPSDIIDENFIILAGELISYTGTATDVVVPEGVTKVEADAFRGNTAITSVTLPSTVRTIAAHAFDGCTNLTYVNLPEGMTRIEEYTFYGCTKLTGVTFPSTLQYIGRHAFYNCDGITELTFNEGLTEMGVYAFYACDGLTAVTFPTTLKTIPEYAFASTGKLASIKWAEGLETIGERAFSESSIGGTVVFPVSLKTVEDSAFIDCEFTTVIFRSNLETIGKYAFRRNPITSLTFSQNHALTSIGDFAFDGNKLSTITLPDSLKSIGTSGFYSTLSNPITVYCAASTPPKISESSLHTYYHTGYSTSYSRTVNLYVPTESVEAYAAATNWKKSKTINPYNFN